MIDLHIDQPVRLTKDIPELELRIGDIGILCSKWGLAQQQPAYEVEFAQSGQEFKTRTLLLAEHIQPHQGNQRFDASGST